MKNTFTLLFLLFSISLFGQLDTIVAYDLETQTIEIIPPIEYDANITNDKTASFIGTMDGFTELSNEVPTENLFPNTNFTQLTKTADLFNLSDYPMRTSVAIIGITKAGTPTSCSGTLISNNMVITAGHCTFDWFNNVEFFIESMEVLPSFNNGELPPGISGANVTKVFINKKAVDGDSFFDVCILLLDQPIGTSLGYQGIGYAPPNELTEKVFHKMSYPFNINASNPNGLYNGDTTYYNYGQVQFDPLLGFLFLEGTSSIGIPGQSGSGLFEFIDQDPTIYGILSFSNYQHFQIPPRFFYQLKNIIENYEIISSTVPIKKDIRIKIQPNPFEDFTTIVLPENLTSVPKYKLIDLGGKIVQQGKINSQSITLSRNGLASGTYVFTIILDNGEMISEQIVIL